MLLYNTSQQNLSTSIFYNLSMNQAAHKNYIQPDGAFIWKTYLDENENI